MQFIQGIKTASDTMKTPGQYEREIADRDKMIERLKGQLVNALEALAQEHAKRMAAAKILTSDAA